MLRLEVIAAHRLSEHFLRLTIGGDDLADFEYQGWDQLFRLFFPRPGQTGLRMPSAANNGWIAQLYLMPVTTRPHVRNYTVRAFRAAQRELDVDFVVHGDGPAATWALAAGPGDPVGIFDEGTMYRPRQGAHWQLLVAEESAAPAALAIAEQTPASLPTTLYLEVPTAADILPVTLGPHVNVRWLPRDTADTADTMPGRLALDTVSHATLPAGHGSVFIAGESGLATGLRRILTSQHNIPKQDITFFGYWKHGRSSLG
jgi:NADPH-dependent ferric siderophore reductase